MILVVNGIDTNPVIESCVPVYVDMTNTCRYCDADNHSNPDYCYRQNVYTRKHKPTFKLWYGDRCALWRPII